MHNSIGFQRNMAQVLKWGSVRAYLTQGQVKKWYQLEEKDLGREKEWKDKLELQRNEAVRVYKECSKEGK
jgi:hypothetical protein